MISSPDIPMATIFASTGFMAFIFVLIALSLMWSLCNLIAMWLLFNKAGHSGFKSIIPLYNIYTLFKIAWGNGWFFLLLAFPFINMIIQIIFCMKLAKSFGKGTAFGLGLIFFYPLFILILGFGQSLYLGPTR